MADSANDPEEWLLTKEDAVCASEDDEQVAVAHNRQATKKKSNNTHARACSSPRTKEDAMYASE